MYKVSSYIWISVIQTIEFNRRKRFLGSKCHWRWDLDTLQQTFPKASKCWVAIPGSKQAKLETMHIIFYSSSKVLCDYAVDYSQSRTGKCWDICRISLTSPCNFHIFAALKDPLHGQRHASVDDINEAVSAQLRTIQMSG